MDDKNKIEKKKQSKDKSSERIFENLYSNYILKKEFEFAIRTNELIECNKENLPDNHGFPDFLLSLDNQKIIAEVTTAHDLDDPSAIDSFRPKVVKVISGGPTGKISARIYNKMIKGNFKNVNNFHLPIIFVVFNSQNGSFIDKVQISTFLTPLNDYKIDEYENTEEKTKITEETKEKLMHDNNLWCIDKIPRNDLISGILFIETTNNNQVIGYFENKKGKNKISNDSIKKLENPRRNLTEVY